MKRFMGNEVYIFDDSIDKSVSYLNKEDINKLIGTINELLDGRVELGDYKGYERWLFIYKLYLQEYIKGEGIDEVYLVFCDRECSKVRPPFHNEKYYKKMMSIYEIEKG